MGLIPDWREPLAPRLHAGIVFGVRPGGPGFLAAAAGLMVATSLLASAAFVNRMQALRAG